jgi:hypothetical protein
MRAFHDPPAYSMPRNIFSEFSLLHIFSLVIQPWMSAYIRKTDGVYMYVFGLPIWARGRFVSGNCHNLCHWTVSSEDSCTRCTNWVVGVDLWKVNLNLLLKTRLQLMPPTQNSSSSTSLVQMRANTHVSSSVTDVVDILDVNYDDLFCDYNTLTTVNSVINTWTVLCRRHEL